ncbi:Myotrophin [Handroanthus impetiginosus]|uniref:Myotrophin n=1 Tax=Handroanthus impetiginosus TaxID=429701 RepID=A0A2G9H040_9LAMI|nr:Myotrophin [Handroanthus impetiginosus]
MLLSLLQYAEKLFVRKPKENYSVAQQLWDAVRANDKKAVYGLIVNSETDINAIYGQGNGNSSLTLAKVMLLQEQTASDPYSGCLEVEMSHKTYPGSLNPASTSEGNNSSIEDLDGCSLLHLACETADIGMIELLLQYGANINATDSRAQMPLHRCIIKGKTAFAKLLLMRGADPRATDDQGRTPFQLAMESNFDDSEVLALLSDSHG